MSESKNIPVDILIVDDEPVNLLALEHVLDGMGVTLVKANSGYEALEKTLKHDFSLVLMDIQMPEIDGYQTVEMMLSADHCKNTPVIFLTASSLEEINFERGYLVGGIDYVTKPINQTILRTKVDMFVRLFRERVKLEMELAEKKTELARLQHGHLAH